MRPALESNRSLAASIGKNTLFGAVASIVQMLTRLITIPVVIAHLGLDGYGIWNIIMTTAAYMRFGSVGVKCAFQKYVAEATGSGNYENANHLLSTGTAAMCVLSFAGLLPIAYFSTNLARAAGAPENFLGAMASSISVLAVIMVISNIGAVFEAMVMGGHRIDIVRKSNTVLSILECIGIVLFLRFGYGLVAMAVVMAVSELALILWCYINAFKVVPAIQLRLSNVTRKVVPELLRFAGSYQLVNVLEVIYVAITPVAILKLFGAHFSGVYAVSGRLIAAAILIQEAALLPLLSGGTAVFASGSTEKTRLLLSKAFKVTMALTLPPVALSCVFGPTIILAWTGETDPAFLQVLLSIGVAGFFRAVSLLCLVLYRATGGAVMDVIRQALRIVTILLAVVVGMALGPMALLWGLAVAEFVGMVFMMFALLKIFPEFNPKRLLPDTLKLLVGTAGVLGVCMLVAWLVPPLGQGVRFTALIKIVAVGVTSLAVLWPALLLTKYLTPAEGRAILDVISQYRRRLTETGQEG